MCAFFLAIIATGCQKADVQAGNDNNQNNQNNNKGKKPQSFFLISENRIEITSV